MIEPIIAALTIVAFVAGFLLVVVSWSQDAILEKYYRESVITTLEEPGYLPEPIGKVSEKIIIDSGNRFSPLRTYLLKKWAQIKGERVPPVILVFGLFSDEEKKAFLIQQAFVSIVDLSLIDLDFSESMIHYLAYQYSFRSDKIEEKVCSILRRGFENCKYRKQLLNLDSIEFSSKVVLNPPPLRKPVLTNLVLPMIREKEKEVLDGDLTLGQIEQWKSFFMTLIEALSSERCAVLFIGYRMPEEYFLMYEENFGRFDFFIFGARGKFVPYVQLICKQIEGDFLEKWNRKYERWEISGVWEFKDEELEDAKWIVFQKKELIEDRI